MRACAAARTFSTRIGRKRSISNDTVPLGLATKSIAPSSIASKRGHRARLGQRRDHHHRPRRLDHDLAETRQPVHARHLDVESHDLRVEGTHQLERLHPVAGEPDVEVALGLENILQHFPHQRGIVGDEKLDHEACDAGSRRERSNLANMSASTRSRSCVGIDQQDHAALRLQVDDAADQPHLLGRQLRRRRDGAGRNLQHFGYGIDQKSGLPTRHRQHENALLASRFRRGEAEAAPQIDDRDHMAAQIHHALDEGGRLGEPA